MRGGPHPIRRRSPWSAFCGNQRRLDHHRAQPNVLRLHRRRRHHDPRSVNLHLTEADGVVKDSIPARLLRLTRAARQRGVSFRDG
jgi:hypothetical protein